MSSTPSVEIEKIHRKNILRIPDLRGYSLSGLFFSAVASHYDHEFKELKRTLKVSTSHLHQIEASVDYCAFPISDIIFNIFLRLSYDSSLTCHSIQLQTEIEPKAILQSSISGVSGRDFPGIFLFLGCFLSLLQACHVATSAEAV